MKASELRIGNKVGYYDADIDGTDLSVSHVVQIGEVDLIMKNMDRT